MTLDHVVEVAHTGSLLLNMATTAFEPCRTRGQSLHQWLGVVDPPRYGHPLHFEQSVPVGVLQRFLPSSTVDTGERSF